MNKLIAVMVVVAFVGCKKSPAAEKKEVTKAEATPVLPSSAPVATAKPAAVVERPFSVVGAHTFTAPQGCATTDLNEYFTVIVGPDPKQPCKFDLEDGYMVSFTMKVTDVQEHRMVPLPKPGQKFDVKLQASSEGVKKIDGEIDATVEVLRHEKPYVVVHITPKTDKLPKNMAAVGGTMRVLFREDDPSYEIAFDAWVASK
jgi:hypothetical protein